MQAKSGQNISEGNVDDYGSVEYVAPEIEAARSGQTVISTKDLPAGEAPTPSVDD